jgi:hypothetical protein
VENRKVKFTVVSFLENQDILFGVSLKELILNKRAPK